MSKSQKNANKRFPGELLKLGTFELTQSVIRVSDPGYDRDVWCCGTVENCKTGMWEAAVFQRDEDDWGVRVGIVAARYAANGPEFSEVTRDAYDCMNDWSECPFEVGVDSGQAGIFDEAHYMDDGIFDQLPVHDFGEQFYSHCCDITLGDPPAGVIPYGVVSSSGYGDGGYVAMKHTAKDGKIDGIFVVFLD